MLETSELNGPVMEIGCGTGFISEKLVDKFPRNEIVLTDLSQDMLELCRIKIQNLHPGNNKIQYKILDGESICEENQYSLIISGFTFQWFNNLHSALLNIRKALRREGILLFSMPVNGSFKEWSDACEKLNIPYTANKLPICDELENWFKVNGWKGTVQIKEEVLTYNSALDFFKSIKNIGASTQEKANSSDRTQIRKLINYLDEKNRKNNKFMITYNIMYCCMKK